MKKVVVLILLIGRIGQAAPATTIDSLTYEPFGKIVLYHPVQPPTSVALFVSGDGGWELGVINMARNIANQGALVVGIDARHYRQSLSKQSSACHYPAADFERLSLMIQKKYCFKTYTKPVLIGFSYGATLVYGILAQAPANTFKGAIALGFCPDIELSKPLCKGTALSSHPLKPGKLYYLDRTQGLTAPFIALNGLIDENCAYAATQTFLKDMPMAELVTLPKVGHGFSVTKNWLPQFMVAYRQILAAPSFSQQKATQNTLLKSQNLMPLPGNLPLTLIPSPASNDLPLVFFISGDGGWTSFDQSLAEALAEKGMPVVGLDAQKYFWDGKTPGVATTDISRAVVHYLEQWHRGRFALLGFSFGASVVPFVAARLPDTLKARVTGVYCLSPDEYADFEIHIEDMLDVPGTAEPFRVLPELTKIKALNPVCLFGKEEEASLLKKLTTLGIKTTTLPGGHHYEDLTELANIIQANLKKR